MTADNERVTSMQHNGLVLRRLQAAVLAAGCAWLVACGGGGNVDSDAELPVIDAPNIPPGCGDGIVNGREQCDDGNNKNDDACTVQCKLSLCGDGILRATVEQCDDGNLIDADGCTSECMVCDAGDFAYGGHCYRKLPAPMNWDQARVACSAIDGYIVSLADGGEQMQINLAIQGRFWLGLENTNPMFDSVSNYSTWESGQRDGPRPFVAGTIATTPATSGFVVASRGDGSWDLQARGLMEPVVCEISNRWLFAKDRHAYLVLPGPFSWTAAAAVCTQLGAALVSYETDLEFGTTNPFAFPLRRVDVPFNNQAWIGMTDEASEGNFRWLTGAAFTLSRAWYVNPAPNLPEPEGGFLQNCGGLFGFGLFDDDCVRVRGAICEAN
jgi:cysteine-rich repeat protein